MKNCANLYLTCSIIVISATSFTGCSYDNVSINDDLETDDYDIYVYGSLNGKNAYWLNGEVHTLKLTDAYIRDAAVANGDFYLAGYTGSRPNSTAKYWKNGVEVILGMGGATGIAVSGSAVYVVGWEDYGEAKYWKNNTPAILGGSMANLLAISGTEFYVAGYTNLPNGHTNPFYPKLWKNGILVELPQAHIDVDHINSLAISGKDIYLAGFEDYYNSYSTRAKYWKNGVITYLDGSQALDIAVKGDDVYIIGFRKGKACLWKNDIPSELPVQPLLNVTDTFRNPFDINRFLSITTYRDDILIKAGSILLKNDTIVSPFDGSNSSIDLTYGGIVVAKRKH
jgi:hypothetical protein